MHIVRSGLLNQVRRALQRSRAVVLAGPRQSGKSTLAAQLAMRDGVRWFDLENPLDRQRLQEPLTALSALTQVQAAAASSGSKGVLNKGQALFDGAGPVVIDEVQLSPGLFPVLRVLICRRRSKSEPPCRPNIEPGVEADFQWVGCG